MIETIGTIAKEEHVKTVDHFVIPNSFVLQNLEPFSGYHGNNLPIDQKPDTFLLITTEPYSMEKIFRVADNIRQYTGYQFRASSGNICIGNDSFPFIRIRGLAGYEPVEEIQKHFMDAGIKYQKRKNTDTKALIELKKIFILEKLDDNTYRDQEDDMHYLDIGRQLTWGRFKMVSQWVKNNLDDSNFDAALAVVYANKVLDLVRIYAENVKKERLEEIRQKYIEGILRTD
ncbi:MAG: hypothetical protein PVF73_11850 [Bacteroidales bacterium]|jgi:hypothetical protein